MDDVDTITDSYIRQNSSILIPSNAYLQFFHYFNFEYHYELGIDYYLDGGIVEYSTNGGASWVNATSLFDYGGYNAVIYSPNDNPLAGKIGFGGWSQEYVVIAIDIVLPVDQQSRGIG